MQEKNTKLMKKNVWVTIGRPHSRGITLIALIITIIVMLILVGVTINVALNGGLFNTAKEATSQTQLEADREQLLSAVIGATGEKGELDFNKLDANLPEGFTGSNGTYTSKSGNVFAVDENRKISNAITKETLIKELQNKSVGDKYILNNVEYVVATKDETTVQLISSTPLGSVTLGVGDDTVTGENDIEIALNSYNNALNKIQAECERVTGLSTLPKDIISVRNVVTMNDTPSKYFMTSFKSMYQNSEDLTLIDLYCMVEKSEAWTSDLYVCYEPNRFSHCGLLTAKCEMTYTPYWESCGLLSVKPDLEFSFSSYGTIDANGKITMENPEDFFESAYTVTKGVIPILTINIK